ncbi:hypothetical protein K7432_001411 [Basidiobolus ranarum]|uniref:PH domain-containing protein n=1 Tax=Basidiobolus ranarum TaxID=34480 RepID=A0ABR2X325_9FUNG
MTTVVENTPINHEETPVLVESTPVTEPVLVEEPAVPAEVEVAASTEEPTPVTEEIPAVEEVIASTEEPSPVSEVISAEEPSPVAETIPAEEAVVAIEAATEVPEDIQEVQNGVLYKRGPRPLRLWKNRYFAFHSEPIALEQLRLVSKKYTKAVSAGKEEFEKANSSLFHDIASATVSGEGLLFYYKSTNPDHVEVPLGIVNLGNIESVAAVKAGKPHAFSIKTHAREYVLAAPTADEAKSWVHTVQTKLDSISTLSNPAETAQYKETYDKLVNRQAFNPKTTLPLPTGILSDNEVFSGSDNENEHLVVESQTAETPKETEVAAEGVAAEAVAADANEVGSESPKRKSMFDNFKSFINKKVEKQPETAQIPEEETQAVEQVAAEATPEAAETPAPEVAEEPVVADAKKEEHSANPLSFHLPKFLKGFKKEEKPEVVGEQVEAPVTEVVEPVAEAPITEVVEETPAVVAEEPVVTEEQAEPVRPESPFKRTISNFLNLKKGKSAEVPQDSTEAEVFPPVSESDNLEKPFDIVDNIGETTTPEVVSEEHTSTEDAAEKPKKPTLFKRLSSMVRPITAPKSVAQPATETVAPVVAQPSEAPISETTEEQLPAVTEAVKAN